MTSEKVIGKTVYQAISAVQGELAKTGIAKDRRNSQQNYAFRGIDDIYCALSPLLAAHGLCVLPRVLSREVSERQTKSGSSIFYTVVDVEYDFVSAADNTKHTVRVVGEAMDSADKSSNKAMSAAYKYACLQTFCIPTEGDNDADATTHDNVVPLPKPNSAPVVNKPQRGLKEIEEILSSCRTQDELKKAWQELSKDEKVIAAELKDKAKKEIEQAQSFKNGA